MLRNSLTFWADKFKRAIFPLVFLIFPITASAHEVKPSLALVDLTISDTYQVKIITNLEALIAEIGPEHENTNDAPQAALYDDLRLLSAAELQQRFDGFKARFLEGVELRFSGDLVSPDTVELSVPATGDIDLPRETLIVLSGQVPPGATSITWRWDADFGSSVIRVSSMTGDEPYAAWLQNGEESAAIPVDGPPARGFWESAIDYFEIGYTHILPKGLDHILFVVGLFLLSPKLGPLFWQITAFTVAHSVTLALGILEIVTVSPAIVEPLIAASIAYVCIENLMTDRLHSWRMALVFGFGLLHGLGFAGVLSEIGLGQADFITGLVAFNLGVEAGQISIVLICFAAVYLFMQKPWYRSRITKPASVVIAAIAVWWTFERVFLT